MQFPGSLPTLSPESVSFPNIVIQSAFFLARRTLRLHFHMRVHRYFVYMQTNSSRRSLYTGVTNSIFKRNHQHEDADESTFVGKYRVTRLVYFETFQYVGIAIAREKQIKGWSRKKKEALIRSVNPGWKDLTQEWGKQFSPEGQTQGPSRQKKGALDDN